jgi:hypothetical protein
VPCGAFPEAAARTGNYYDFSFDVRAHDILLAAVRAAGQSPTGAPETLGSVPLTPSDDLAASIPNPAATCRPAGARAAAFRRLARRVRSKRHPGFAMHDMNWRISMH